jgi:hypothetical protein
MIQIKSHCHLIQHKYQQNTCKHYAKKSLHIDEEMWQNKQMAIHPLSSSRDAFQLGKQDLHRLSSKNKLLISIRLKNFKQTCPDATSLNFL